MVGTSNLGSWSGHWIMDSAFWGFCKSEFACLSLAEEGRNQKKYVFWPEPSWNMARGSELVWWFPQLETSIFYGDFQLPCLIAGSYTQSGISNGNCKWTKTIMEFVTWQMSVSISCFNSHSYNKKEQQTAVDILGPLKRLMFADVEWIPKQWII